CRVVGENKLTTKSTTTLEQDRRGRCAIDTGASGSDFGTSAVDWKNIIHSEMIYISFFSLLLLVNAQISEKDYSPLLDQNTSPSNPGIYLRLMPTGLAYMREIGMKVVNEQIMKLSLPTIRERIENGEPKSKILQQSMKNFTLIHFVQNLREKNLFLDYQLTSDPFVQNGAIAMLAKGAPDRIRRESCKIQASRKDEHVIRSDTTMTANVIMWINGTRIIGNATIENLDFKLLETKDIYALKSVQNNSSSSHLSLPPCNVP
ncbi:hypothetical protein TELCIR_13628, partial [Teladorsagia circumcincta]